MGLVVQVPTSLQGAVYKTVQKMSKAIGQCTIIYDRVNGTMGPLTDTTGNSSSYQLEAEIEVDTGYVPTKDEKSASEWGAKVFNVSGTFAGTDVQVGFNVIPMISPTRTDTIKLLVQMYGKNLTSYTDFTADWVLHELDR